MILAVVRHAESVENATKYEGFYHEHRPYNGTAARWISKHVVGLTPRGFRQCQQLREALAKLSGLHTQVYTSTYRRAIDTADLVFESLPVATIERTPLLDEQDYGDATYMAKTELFVTYPDGADDRRERKHLWLPPGGGESLAGGVTGRVRQFLAVAQRDLAADHPVVAITHHTTILALRAELEGRPLTEVVAEARRAKMPPAGILRYHMNPDGRFICTGLSTPAES